MQRWKPAAVLGLASLLVAGAIWHRAAPDAVLASNYGSALAETETSWTSLPPNIWLSRLGGDSLAERSLATGDTITVSTRDGRPQVIEVTGLELIDGDLLGMPGVRFQLVTGTASGKPGEPVRFLFATGARSRTPLPTPADRTL